MCTVSLILLPPLDESSPTCGLRLVCNRDEQRTRPDATPPRWRDLPSTRALWPADGEAGGTWIAANEEGLALCLLNLNPPLPPKMPPPNQLVSRGKIIPHLIASRTPDDALAALSALDLNRFAPFRLLAASPAPKIPATSLDEERWHRRPACDSSTRSGAQAGRLSHSCSHQILEASWDRTDLLITRHHAAPLCLASSGLGDHLVQSRLPLFDGMVLAAGATPEAQDLFHHHTWPDRPELSVMMHRAEARTVSVTTLEILPNAHGGHSHAHAFDVRMRYSPVLTRASADDQSRKAAMP